MSVQNAEPELAIDEVIDETPMWVAVPDCVLFNRALNPSAIYVYALLKRFALRYGEGRVFPGQRYMAEVAGMHQETVAKALSLLEEHGHIRRERGSVTLPHRIVILAPWAIPNPLDTGRHGTPQPEPVNGKSDHARSENPITANGKSVQTKDVALEVIEGEVSSLATQERPVPPQFALWEAFGEAAGVDIAKATTREKNYGLTVAARLVKDGITPDQIRRCVAYMQTEEWRSSLLTISHVEKAMGPWRMAGEPEVAVPRGGMGVAERRERTGKQTEALYPVERPFGMPLAEWNRLKAERSPSPRSGDPPPPDNVIEGVFRDGTR